MSSFLERTVRSDKTGCEHKGKRGGDSTLGCVVEDRQLKSVEQQAWRTLIAVHSRLVGRLDAELQAAHGISLPDFEVLLHLAEAPGEALRMAELAERLVVSPSGLTRRLDGLVRDGLVERRACSSDRRGSLAVLSPAGRATLQRAEPTHLAGVRRYVVEPLQHEDLLALTNRLRLIGGALDANGRRPAAARHRSNGARSELPAHSGAA